MCLGLERFIFHLDLAFSALGLRTKEKEMTHWPREGGSRWGGCRASRVDPKACPPKGLGLGPMLKVLSTLNNSGWGGRGPLGCDSLCKFKTLVFKTGLCFHPWLGLGECRGQL